MRSRITGLAVVAAALGLLMYPDILLGDEGMWLFNKPPRAELEKRYHFNPTDQWLNHVRLSSVRFNSGGSGSFISPHGLVMTNHHVGAGDLEKVSTREKNYLRDGFYAKNSDEEIKCKGLELNVLIGIKDVTAEIEKAVPAGTPAAEAFKLRRGKMSELEKAAADPDKNIRADVVTLYAGGMYNLYSYKAYTDIRIVFAPEKQIAFYGGDPDNFEYPRYDLDICFFRVYDNGKPIDSENYLRWSPRGSSDDELVFVSGHPGRTNRGDTADELKYLRDIGYPYLLSRLNRLEVLLNSWGARSEQNMVRAEEELFSIQNSRKARNGGLSGLMDPALMGKKESDEDKLKAYISGHNLTEAKNAYGAIEKAEKVRAEIIKDYTLLEAGQGFNCDSFRIARALLRASEELPKPNNDRLREFGDARLKSLKNRLFSDEPIFPDFETLKLANSLEYLAIGLGPDTQFAKKILAGKSPKERAFELIKDTRVRDVEFRKKLFEEGKAAVDASRDPMIELARLVDGPARALRKRMEDEIEEPESQAHAALTKARFAMYGDSVYPDATFTLRLAFGAVKGYKEEGKDIPPYTDFAGLYERAKQQGNKGPFELPARWIEKKDKLDLKTPLNFLCTADIIGGNSGSPVINRQGELVGIIFDGNIESLVLDFIYQDTTARAVSVDSRGIIEALRKVYEVNDLVDEILGKQR